MRGGVFLVELVETLWVLSEELLEDKLRLLRATKLLELLPRRILCNKSDQTEFLETEHYHVRDASFPDMSVTVIWCEIDGDGGCTGRWGWTWLPLVICAWRSELQFSR